MAKTLPYTSMPRESISRGRLLPLFGSSLVRLATAVLFTVIAAPAAAQEEGCDYFEFRLDPALPTTHSRIELLLIGWGGSGSHFEGWTRSGFEIRVPTVVNTEGPAVFFPFTSLVDVGALSAGIYEVTFDILSNEGAPSEERLECRPGSFEVFEAERIPAATGLGLAVLAALVGLSGAWFVRRGS
jgi:hypothetical protein